MPTRWILLVMLCATMLLSCCKPPSGPDIPRDEPDTVRSSVQALITTPTMTNFLWIVHKPDTTFPIQPIVDCFHNIRSDEGYIQLTFIRIANFSTRQYKREDNGDIISLRSWNNEYLSFYLSTQQSVFTPLTLQKVFAFDWQQPRMDEHFVPPGPQNSSGYIQASETQRTVNIQYKYNFTDTPIYSSRIERASLTLDQYNLVTKRVSGRFSFRVVSQSGQVVDIQNGSFENVKLRRFAD